MARGKKHTPEQIVSLLRQIEVAVANGKMTPAACREGGITDKIIGWHSFRHSLATNLRSPGVDVKVAQELLRHANSRATMDLYTQAISADKQTASVRQVELLLA